MSDEVWTVLQQFRDRFDVWLHAQIFENEFLVAGVGTVLLGALAYVARDVPSRLWRALLRAFTTTLTIQSDTESFPHTMSYINKHRLDMLQRTFMFGVSCDHGESNWTLGPGYGGAVFLFEGRPVVAGLEKEESVGMGFRMTLTLRFLGPGVGRVERFVERVHQFGDLSRRGVHVRAWVDEGYWTTVVENKPRRALGTVHLPSGVKRELVERVERFYSGEQWYRERGLDWRMGVMLGGPPGTGKTSLIHALASHFDRDIRYLSLGNLRESHTAVVTSMLSARDILVIEDMDTFGVTGRRGEDRKTGDDPALSLSGLLNILDGLLSPDGCLIVATTNHLDQLDPALVRPGRFDLTLELGPLDDEALAGMFAAFHGEEWRERVLSLTSRREVTGAETQRLLRDHGPSAALAQLTGSES